MIDRRHMLAGASAAAAAMTVTRAAFGGWEPSERYPDPAIQALDPSFNNIALRSPASAAGDSCQFNEGAIYFGDTRCLLWSDIPNNRIMRWDEGRPCGVFAGRRTTPMQHSRSSGQADHLRAQRSADYSHRV
jgi:gluconolactonase